MIKINNNNNTGGNPIGRSDYFAFEELKRESKTLNEIKVVYQKLIMNEEARKQKGINQEDAKIGYKETINRIRDVGLERNFYRSHFEWEPLNYIFEN